MLRHIEDIQLCLSVFLHSLSHVEHCVVLDRADQQAGGMALVLERTARAAHGEVVPLGTASYEIDFGVPHPKGSGCLRARVLQCRRGRPSPTVSAGRITEHFVGERGHGVMHLGANRGGGGVVEVDGVHCCESALAV